ncbi:hypothetical protein Tco_0673689, partial [Tanacetum coccineum]
EWDAEEERKRLEEMKKAKPKTTSLAQVAMGSSSQLLPPKRQLHPLLPLQLNRYPLTQEVLSQMLDLKLETEEESTIALELIKFVKQQLEEFEDSNDDELATSDHGEAERV